MKTRLSRWQVYRRRKKQQRLFRERMIRESLEIINLALDRAILRALDEAA